MNLDSLLKDHGYGGSVGTADVGQVLVGYTFSNSKKINIAGHLPDSKLVANQQNLAIASANETGVIAYTPTQNDTFTLFGLIKITATCNLTVRIYYFDISGKLQILTPINYVSESNGATVQLFNTIIAGTSGNIFVSVQTSVANAATVTAFLQENGSTIFTQAGVINVIASSWLGIANDSIGRNSFGAAYDSSADLTYAIDSGFSGISTCTAYSDSANTWTAIANDPIARYGITAAYSGLSNLTYSMEGINSSGNYTTANYGYSHASNSWTGYAALGSNSIDASGAYDSDTHLVYKLDGENGNAGTSGQATLFAYSSITNSWTSLASDLYSRTRLAAVYDSSAKLTYGIDGASYNGTAWTDINSVSGYSHSSNTWTALATDTLARDSLGAAYDSSANLTYAIDGNTSYPSTGTDLSTVTAYSHQTNTWTALADDVVARRGLQAVYNSAANKTYAIDGNTTTVSSYQYARPVNLSVAAITP